MISDKAFNTDGTQTIFASDFPVISEDHLRVFLDTVIVSRDDYDLINNAAVFFEAPTTGQNLVVQVGTTPGEVLSAPTDIGIVSSSITNVNQVANNIANVLAVDANSANVTIVSTNMAKVKTVALDIADVRSVAGNEDNITAAVANATNINNAVANADNISAAAANETNINLAVANATNINTAVANEDDITTVATNVSSVNTVAGIGDTGLQGIVDNETHITSVGKDIANVNTTAANMDAVNKVSANISAVTTVSASIAHVKKVSEDLQETISEIEIVANDLNETTSDIETVAASAGNVDKVGAAITNVNTVAADIAKVKTVAADIAKVKTVAADIAKVNTVAADIAKVKSVGNNITKVKSVADNETNINKAVSELTAINNYADTYSSGATAPNPPSTGDLWFDTAAQTMKVYSTSGWLDTGSSVNGTVNSTQQTATAGQTSFPVTYDPGYVQVFLNGIRLDTADYTATDGANIVLTSGAGLNDTFFAQSFSMFALADHYDKAASDARYETIDATILRDLVEDTTPQLGGDLDLNNKNITGTGDIPAGNLTGNMPAIDGSALTGIDVLPSQTNKSGKVLMSDGSDASWVSVGRKNLIINGAMQVAQRGTSAENVGTNSVQTVDMFMNNHDSTYYTSIWSQQSTDAPDGFSHSHKVSVNSVTGTKTASSFLQPFKARLENNILTPLASGTSSAKEMTLSFWVKSNDTGTKSVSVVYGLASGWTGDKALIKAFTINSADTWEKKVLTFPANTTITNTTTNPEGTTLGMDIGWWMSSGSTFSSGTEQSSWGQLIMANAAAGVSNNATTGTYYQITGVQLEVGSVATDFEHRSYGEDLALCQRYYQKVRFKSGSGTLHYFLLCGAYETGTHKLRGSWDFVTRMRDKPTFTWSGILNAHPQLATVGLTMVSETTDACSLNVTHLGVATAGYAYNLYFNGYGYLKFNAEL